MTLPETASACAELGILLESAGRPSEAAKAFRRASCRSDGESSLYFMRRAKMNTDIALRQAGIRRAK